MAKKIRTTTKNRIMRPRATGVTQAGVSFCVLLVAIFEFTTYRLTDLHYARVRGRGSTYIPTGRHLDHGYVTLIKFDVILS